MRKKNVVLGFLGTTLDRARRANRFDGWRPSVSVTMHAEELPVDRFILIHGQSATGLARQIRSDIGEVSPDTDVEFRQMEFTNAWDFEEVFSNLLDFTRSFPFDPDDEEYYVHLTTGTHVAQICLFLLTEARYFPAKFVQSSPGQEPPLAKGSLQIVDLDLSKYNSIAQRFAEERRDRYAALKSGINTRNARFNSMIERIERVAVGSKAPILIMGPTGAGKSQLARRIYELKKDCFQVSGNFVEVNCATLRGDSSMSALFGHIKGAFTGAATGRDGYLKKADKGILFLDEIGELGTDEQAMLLRALEDKVFFPLGADAETESDFQLIGGTNKELGALSREGKFREDLLARINLWTFQMPGLAERREDIEPNIEYELERFARLNNSLVTFTSDAREQFLKFSHTKEAIWNANFRDLNAAITRMATLAVGGRITMPDVDEEILRLQQHWEGITPQNERAERLLRKILPSDELDQLDRFERVQLEDVVSVIAASDSLAGAGRTLFHASRERKNHANDTDRLRKYLAKFGLEFGAVKARLVGM